MDNSPEQKTSLNVEHLECSNNDLKTELLPHLMGHIFHVTDAKGYQGINNRKAIYNNMNGRYKYRYHKSKNSYGSKRGFVCLFDLRSVAEDDLEIALGQFYFFNPPYTDNNPIFLIIKEKIDQELIPWTVARNEIGHNELFVSFIECWYPQKIPMDFISKVLKVKIIVDPNPISELLVRAEKQRKKYKSP